MDRGLVIKQKLPRKGPERPVFSYHLSPALKRHIIDILSEPYTEFVSIPFSKLKHLCRFEKGGYCRKTREVCEAKNAARIQKKKKPLKKLKQRRHKTDEGKWPAKKQQAS